MILLNFSSNDDFLDDVIGVSLKSLKNWLFINNCFSSLVRFSEFNMKSLKKELSTVSSFSWVYSICGLTIFSGFCTMLLLIPFITVSNKIILIQILVPLTVNVLKLLWLLFSLYKMAS